MTETRDVSRQEATAAQDVKQQEQAILPDVDIFENEAGITVQADMPGVSRDRLDVHIDSDTLTIEGKAVIPMPEGMDALYADIRSTRYQRSFSLSRELDSERIEAALKDGVLTLHIPKREEHRPRRIEIQTA
ncbi:MAG: Hsp20/alpha crystallin family protein [Gammaproteobacteria bacterium]|jgi:HSP20 family molecular chaperone IbpA